MHECLITRGDAEGSSEENYIKIFAEVNVVLVCSGRCHEFAQFGDEGWYKCLDHLLKFYTKEDIYSWLDKLDLSIVAEVRRKIENKEDKPEGHAGL